MELVRRLAQREADGNPVQVGVIGCGQMGSGLSHTINRITGMAIRAVADVDPQRGIDVFAAMGYQRDDIVLTERVDEAEDACRTGRRVVTPDAVILTRLESLEANVEATGVPEVGALIAWESISSGKPIIMLNVETDITVGPLLSELARRNDTVYTVASGDEPGVLKMLWEQATVMGFEVVCLGKGKNNRINYYATAESAKAEAESKGMNPKILAAFQDGTKTMVELAAVSNATGLVPDRTGLHGPAVDVPDLIKTFIPAADGGVFSQRGCVDFSTGKVAPGVFAIVYTDEPRVRKDMKFITGSDGPYYLQLRPYHLCDIETPQSVAEAVLLGERTVGSDRLVSEVVCKAKRDLKAGALLGGIGGDDWFGTIMSRENADSDRALPIGIAAGARLARDVDRDTILTRDDVELPKDSFVNQLRALQDGLAAKGAL